MRSGAVVGCTIAALSAAICGTALAATPAGEAVIVDAKGDVPGALDVAAVRFGLGEDQRLRAIVTMAAPWESKALLAGDDRVPGSVCLRLYTKADPAAAAPDYLVCATVAADGASMRGEVLRERGHTLPKLIGKATVTRPTQRSITIRFARSAIGSPKSLRFGVEATKPGCSSATCVDSVPDAPKTARYPAVRDAKD
ncbi:MAG TPA: hypothetical protein VFB41_08385 [Solirubrobacteraceae bacterium]|nr:hypothetical protein [Solirubrobacteraceae bacterium]